MKTNADIRRRLVGPAKGDDLLFSVEELTWIASDLATLAAAEEARGGLTEEERGRYERAEWKGYTNSHFASTAIRFDDALRLANAELARVKREFVYTMRRVEEAVNETCTCGGNGPGEGCLACEVWHATGIVNHPARWPGTKYLAEVDGK